MDAAREAAITYAMEVATTRADLHRQELAWPLALAGCFRQDVEAAAQRLTASGALDAATRLADAAPWVPESATDAALSKAMAARESANMADAEATARLDRRITAVLEEIEADEQRGTVEDTFRRGFALLLLFGAMPSKTEVREHLARLSDREVVGMLADLGSIERYAREFAKPMLEHLKDATTDPERRG